MIYTKLIGGLGNQMFQYAAGRSLAVANNCKLKLDVSGFENYTLHNGYELELFNIKSDIASAEDIFRLVRTHPKLLKFLFRKFSIKNDRHYVEKSFSFDPDFCKLKLPIYLDGYWQSYKYFESIEKLLKLELKPKSPLSELNLAISNQIHITNSISLHIRRGDYISNQAANQVHGFLGIEYYREAIALINTKVVSPSFFVFSDDIAWAKENLGLNTNVVFIDHNKGKNSFEDMRLMSFCKHNIIANSSFSWWGAWLGDTQNRIVIAPKRWFANNTNTDDLIPASWIRL